MKAIKIEEPKVCPFCGSPVVRILDEGAHLYCSNPNCHERNLAKLNYFVTKECMNIDGLSEKTLRKLRNNLVINKWQDLYNYTFDDFVSAGCGEKTALKIVDELEKSKTEVPAERVLMALGIPSIGKVNAKKLLEEFGSIENINDARFEEIAEIVGEVAAKNVVDYMNNSADELEAICRLFNTKYESKAVASGTKLSGLTLLATGTLNNFSREGIKESVLENGGSYASGISKKLDYLIVGSAAGSSKLKKAAELGIKQITEDEYLNLIK